jgi:hypothetical protein
LGSQTRFSAITARPDIPDKRTKRLRPDFRGKLEGPAASLALSRTRSTAQLLVLTPSSSSSDDFCAMQYPEKRENHGAAGL